MYAGLLPKLISPTHYLKKLGVMPKGSKPAAAVEPPVEPVANPQGQMILLGAAALGLVLLVAGGRRT